MAHQERAAQARIEALTAQAPPPLTSGEALALVQDLGGLHEVLEQADQDERGALYAALVSPLLTTRRRGALL